MTGKYMWKDPIVEEVRNAGKELQRQVNMITNHYAGSSIPIDTGMILKDVQKIRL